MVDVWMQCCISNIQSFCWTTVWIWSCDGLSVIRNHLQRQYLILTYMLTLYSTLICFCHLSCWVVTRCSPTQWWYPFCCELVLSWSVTCLTNLFHLQAFSRARKIAICYITNKRPDRRKSVLLESFFWTFHPNHDSLSIRMFREELCLQITVHRWTGRRQQPL